VSRARCCVPVIRSPGRRRAAGFGSITLSRRSRLKQTGIRRLHPGSRPSRPMPPRGRSAACGPTVSSALLPLADSGRLPRPESGFGCHPARGRGSEWGAGSPSGSPVLNCVFGGPPHNKHRSLYRRHAAFASPRTQRTGLLWLVTTIDQSSSRQAYCGILLECIEFVPLVWHCLYRDG